MHFRKDAINTFKEIFEANKPRIAAFPGCTAVKLYRDAQDECIMFTLSSWDSSEALEQYRRSELFKNTWSKTRGLFASKAETWSLFEIT